MFTLGDATALYIRDKAYDREGTIKNPQRTYGCTRIASMVCGRLWFMNHPIPDTYNDIMVEPFDIMDHPRFKTTEFSDEETERYQDNPEEL